MALRRASLAALAGAIQQYQPEETVMKVLMVLTSHDQLGNTGRKTGFWLEELAAPYYVFKDAGVEITLASPKGGRPPLDPKSNEPEFRTDLTIRFEKDAAANAQLDRTLRLDSVKQEDFDTVFYPGRSRWCVIPPARCVTSRPPTGSRWFRAGKSQALPTARKPPSV
jgi:putative intracellular protease/amidase